MYCISYVNEYVYLFIFLYPLISCFALWSEEKTIKNLEKELKKLKEKKE